MTSIHDLQGIGEQIRRDLGIDGTVGDAQDVEHPYCTDGSYGPCLVCGLAESYRRHVEQDDACRGCGASLSHPLGCDTDCPTLRDTGPVKPGSSALLDFDPDTNPWTGERM